MREVFCQPANMQHAVHGHTALNFQRKMIGRGRKSSERKKKPSSHVGLDHLFRCLGTFGPENGVYSMTDLKWKKWPNDFLVIQSDLFGMVK